MNAHGECGCKGPHIHSAAQGRGKVVGPILDCLYPWFSFYRKLNGPQDQSGHDGVKKNLHPFRHQGSNLGHLARSQAPCRLSYLVHQLTNTVIIYRDTVLIALKIRSYIANTWIEKQFFFLIPVVNMTFIMRVW